MASFILRSSHSKAFMFGNKLGWAISIGIVVATVLLLASLRQLGEVSPPGEIGQKASSWTAELPIAPESAVSFMTDPADATALYQEAITAYEKDRDGFEKYDQLQSAVSHEAQRLKPVLELLIKARSAKDAAIFAPQPAHVIHYDPRRPKLHAVRTLGKASIRLGLLYQQAGSQTARSYFEAAYALGARLSRERLTYGELDVAMSLLGDASAALARLSVSDSARLNQFDQARIDFFKTSIEPVRNVVLALNPNPGDLFPLADNAADRMWRVEAILALGRCKYSAERFGDQQGARVRLAQLANSDDPIIRLAAETARDLTIETYRQLR